MRNFILFLIVLFSAVGYGQEMPIKGTPADTIQFRKYRLLIKDLNLFIKNSPNNAEHYFKRGEYYIMLQDYRQAIADFTRSIEISKGLEAAPYYKRGSVYDRLGDNTNAILDFSMVIKLMPDFEWGFNDRGMIYTEMGDYQKAEADLKKAIALKPQWSVAYASLGYLHDVKKEKLKAKENYEKALKLDVGSSLAHNNLGVIYFSEKQYDKAIEHYNSAIHYSPKYFNAYRNRADAKNAKGDTAGACEDIKTATALGDTKAAALTKNYCK